MAGPGRAEMHACGMACSRASYISLGRAQKSPLHKQCLPRYARGLANFNATMPCTMLVRGRTSERRARLPTYSSPSSSSSSSFILILALPSHDFCWRCTSQNNGLIRSDLVRSGPVRFLSAVGPVYTCKSLSASKLV